MSMHKIDVDALLKQIKINWEDHYIEWDATKLVDNIFEILGVCKQIIGKENKYVGDIIPVSKHKRIYRLYFANRDAVRVSEEL